MTIGIILRVVDNSSDVVDVKTQLDFKKQQRCSLHTTGKCLQCVFRTRLPAH